MSEVNKTVIYKCLQITVVIGAILLVLSKWMVGGNFDDYSTETPEERNSERNERSTPRSFILPATPGVAFEQERQRSNKVRQAQIAKCLGMLRSRGFHVDDSRTLLNAKLVKAIYTFQIDHDLPASGQLDETTMGELKCN